MRWIDLSLPRSVLSMQCALNLKQETSEVGLIYSELVVFWDTFRQVVCPHQQLHPQNHRKAKDMTYQCLVQISACWLCSSVQLDFEADDVDKEFDFGTTTDEAVPL